MPIKFMMMVAPLFVLHHFAFHWVKKYPSLSKFLALAGVIWYTGVVFLVNVDKSLLTASMLGAGGIIPLLLVLRHAVFTQQKIAGRFFYFLALILQIIIIYISVKY